MVKRIKKLADFSKRLRTSQTPWENKLWLYLRAGRFYGFKFKRQVAIEQYIVDFCCNEKKLIIELDGSGHQYSQKDKFRDKFFEDMGYVVLRFWNNEIDENLGGALERIREFVNSDNLSDPLGHLSRLGEKNKEDYV